MAIAPKEPLVAPKEQPFDARKAIVQEKSGGTQKPTRQIIEDALKADGLDSQKILKKLAVMLQNKQKYRLVQIGNTVFFLTQQEPGVVESHIFTQDSPAKIGEAYKKIVAALKKEGMKKGYTYSDNPGFRRVAEMTGLPIKITQTTKQIGNTMKPVYMYEMDF
jgi:hypothetical protein